MSPARFINAVFHSVKKCCAGTKDGCGESSGKKFNIPVHIHESSRLYFRPL